MTQPSTTAPATNPATARAPRRLATLGQVRREMGAVYADAREGRIPPGDASRLVYVLGQIAGVIEGEHIERRLSDLEEKVRP